MNEETNKSVKNRSYMLRYLSHMLFIAIIAAGIAWISHSIILDVVWNPRYFQLSGAILAVIAAYSFVERRKLYETVTTTIILEICFLISALLLLLSDYYINLPFWLIGGIIAAALAERNIGMLYLYYFVFQAVYLQGDWKNGLIFHFVTATLIAFFIPKMKSFISMLYMMTFSSSIIIIGSVIHNEMYIDKNMMLDTFYIMCTYLVCILITMLLIKFFDKRAESGLLKEEEIVNDYSYLDLLARETAEHDAVIAAVATVKEETDYKIYCDERAELLLKLRSKNKAAFAQAVLLGKLAYEMANCIGLNAELVKAAGLYKRIGKIKDNNDELTSVEILKEHQFPDTLVSLIEQLNKNEVLQKEGALLLITDEVISYYSIVRNVRKMDISVEKIVDTIVTKKIFNGDFNEAGLSMQECCVIREKLIEIFKEQDKKRAAK